MARSKNRVVALRGGLPARCLGRLHPVPESASAAVTLGDVLGRAGPVERVVRLLVGLHRAEVGGLRLRVGLDLLVQPDHVVRERDEILARDGFDVCELALALSPAAERAEASNAAIAPPTTRSQVGKPPPSSSPLGSADPAGSPTRRTKSVRTAATPSSLLARNALVASSEPGSPRSLLTARN